MLLQTKNSSVKKFATIFVGYLQVVILLGYGAPVLGQSIGENDPQTFEITLKDSDELNLDVVVQDQLKRWPQNKEIWEKIREFARFKSVETKSFDGDRATVYSVLQGEYSATGPEISKKIEVLNSVGAASCVIVAIRNPSTGKIALSHFDAMTAVNGSLTAMLASIDSETEKNLEVTLGSSGDDPGKILEIIAGLQNKGLNFPHFIATSSLGISTNGDVFTNYFRSFPDKDAKARYEFLHSTIAKILETTAKLIERSNNGDMSAIDLIRDKRHHRLVIQRGPGLAVENRTISNPQPVNQLGIY